MKEKLFTLSFLLFTFAAQAEMKEMPEGYTMLDCLTTQSGAYVDTGVPASKTLRAEMDFAPLEYTGEVSLGMKTQSDEVDWRFFNYL